jgi:hypothetical protein
VKHSPPHPQMLSQPAHHTLAHPLHHHHYIALRARRRVASATTSPRRCCTRPGTSWASVTRTELCPSQTLQPGRSTPKGRTTTCRHRVDQTRGH